MSLVIDLIDLVAKHKSGELRCPATALILLKTQVMKDHGSPCGPAVKSADS